MQLSQPVKGAHPGGSGVSALDHLMGDWATVPEDRGIFLAKTWRMQPDLCRFVSDAFYDGRLESEESDRATDADSFGDAGGALAPLSGCDSCRWSMRIGRRRATRKPSG